MSIAIDTALQAPFLGLRYFDEEQSHLFFGREPQVNDVLEKLRRSRLVMVMGSSGSGKSSLVRAGVVPSLKAGFLRDAGPRWRIAKMRPGGSPISNLGRELEKALSIPGLDVTLRRGPLGLVQAVEECRLPANENVLVIADQFEELFRYPRESDDAEAAKEEAAAFVKLLLEATNQRSWPIYVMVTMRSDYLGNCAQFRDLPERINEGLYLIPRMRRDQLEQAITGPVAVEDATIAPRLVQKLLNDTGNDPDQLPVLQHSLLRAWNTWKQASRPLDLEDLDAIGGMKESLSRHADEIFERLSADQQRIARVVFQQLCDRDTEGREIRRPAPVAHVAAVAGVTVRAVEEVVGRFAAPEAALLYQNEDGHLDIAHESLIRKWRLIQGTRLRAGADAKGWMQEEVEAHDQFLLLIERTRKKDTLRERALEEARRWRALGLNAAWARRYTKTTSEDTTFQDVLAFIEGCSKKDVRRRGLLIGLVVTALALMAIFVVVVWRQKTVANDAALAARIALAQASTQEGVRLVAASQPGEALAHLARALRSDPESLGAKSWISDLLINERLWVTSASLRHGAGIWTAVFSSDGDRVLTASLDRTARIWDAATGQPVGAPLRHSERVFAAAFSPDGHLVVTASADNTARVWNPATGQPVGAPFQHQGYVMSATFSPDGSRVVTGSADKTARVWDVATGQPVGASLRHQDKVNAAGFSPNGRRIVTASDDHTARVWDAITGQPITGPLRHLGQVNAATFSSDGRRVVTASDDHSARVWDAVTGQPVGSPLQHEWRVFDAAFSPDGDRVLTASEDNTARVWDATTGERVGVPLQHQGYVRAAAFSPDGRRIVTASFDRTARVWDAVTYQPIGAPLRHPGLVRAIAFSPDGRRVVTGSDDYAARIWSAATGQPGGAPLQRLDEIDTDAISPDGRRIVTIFHFSKLARVRDAVTGESVGAPLQHQDRVLAAAFSPDGNRVVTASADGTAGVWDAATGRPVGASLQHQRGVNAAAFSPDGLRVVTASDDATARVWDVVTRAPIGAPLQHQDRVLAAAFSPDGRRVVTGSADNTARIWDSATGQPIGARLQHQENVLAAAFSPDGRRVVTASYDNTARVWDAITGQPVGAPLQHGSQVNTAVFSPDGRRIVTASDDNTARVWEAATGQPLGAPLQHESAVLKAVFTPDGRRVVTSVFNRRGSVWQVLLDVRSAESVQRLIDLAEVVGGYRVTDLSSVVPLQEPDRLQRVRRLVGDGATAFVPFEVLLGRFLNAR